MILVRMCAIQTKNGSTQCFSQLAPTLITWRRALGLLPLSTECHAWAPNQLVKPPLDHQLQSIPINSNQPVPTVVPAVSLLPRLLFQGHWLFAASERQPDRQLLFKVSISEDMQIHRDKGKSCLIIYRLVENMLKTKHVQNPYDSAHLILRTLLSKGAIHACLRAQLFGTSERSGLNRAHHIQIRA